MSVADAYASLSSLFDYPQAGQGLKEALGQVGAFVEERRLACTVSPFAAFLETTPLAGVQEEYVATFDFNPATAPYLGHHLYGDNQKKAGYMMALKQEYGRHDFVPAGNELPDHLAVVLGFLAHLAKRGEEAALKLFIERFLLSGMQRLQEAFGARQTSPWRVLVEAAERVCCAACEEVVPC